MNRRSRPLGLAVLAGCLIGTGLACSQAAWAAEARVERPRVVTMTRGVRLFHELEYNLVDAVRGAAPEALDRLLADDFEQRSAGAPGVPEPRDEWLAQTPLRSAGAVQISEMAVHDHGDLAVVSFRLSLQATRQASFVVDVWRRTGTDTYQLLTRYVSDAGGVSRKPRGRVVPDGKG